MSNPDFSKDPELVECAKAVARVYSPKDEWEQFTPYMQRQLFSLCDAARTFFGSGYRLPETTEANAERLAKVRWRNLWGSLMELTRQCQCRDSLTYLRAMHVAFGEPAEKPEPATEQKCNCADCNPANWPETNGWRCGKKPEPKATRAKQCPAASGDHRCELEAWHEGPHSQGVLVWEDEPGSSKAECPGPDFAAEAAERERRRLLEAFMRDMVSNPAVMAKMLENYEADEDAGAARLHEIALAFARELIG